MTTIMDGKALAKKHEDLLRERIQKLKATYTIPEVYPELSWPRLVSFSNFEDPITHTYTKLKGEKANQLGILFVVLYTYSGLSLEQLSAEIKKHNQDLYNTGVMIQLPLPEPLNAHTQEVLQLIEPHKDVDGLTENSHFLPATVRGVMSLFVEYGVYPDKSFGVVGSEGIVGKRMIKALQKAGAKEVIAVDKKNPQSSLDQIKPCDVIISCTGVKDLIKPEMIKDGVVLIDVGLGDFEAGCFSKASMYTPTPGGVGPMTVISLMENVIDAWEKTISLPKTN